MFINADMWDVQYLYDDALVVTTRIDNHNIHHVVINNCNFVNILSRVAYDQMGLPNDWLKLSFALLYGFSR